MKDEFKRLQYSGRKCGPMGYHCTGCCGPVPKYRPQWRRLWRTRFKRATQREIRSQLS